VVFSIGIGIGSLLCEMLSRRHVEIGLVPLGAIGMSVFSIDLYFSSRGLPPSDLLTLAGFVARPAHWRVMADLLLLSLFAGLYSVPMYALIQLRSQPTHRARIIAANNILNALFMIASSLIAGALLTAGFTIPEIFLVTGVANAVVSFYIFLVVPEYLLRFVAWALSRFVYRYKVVGDEHIPLQGAAVLACNHVSYVDAVLLMAASPRPIRFLMDHRIFRVPVLGWLFKLAKAIPVAPRSEDPAAYEAAFEAAAQVLREGDLLGIFPEGGITRDGALQPFKGGIVKLLERAQADGTGGAGDPDGADQPVGLVLQPHRAGQRRAGGHGAAVSARLIQPRGAERGPTLDARPGATGRAARAHRRFAGALNVSKFGTSRPDFRYSVCFQALEGVVRRRLAAVFNPSMRSAMTSLMKQRFLAGALALGLLATVPAQARNDASAYSALSTLPLASVAAVGGAAVAAPVLLSTAGTLLVVKGVQASAQGTVFVLERAADGARASVEIAGRAAAGSALAVGTVVTVSVISAGVLLSAGGEVIAFIPNEVGRALLHHERVSS
jgi:1-acyl-sn-glycerol-3-phosphate acyltransferase